MGFAAETVRQLEERLSKLGFRRRHGVLWAPLGSGAKASLGLGRATYGRSDVADITVVVGVRFEELYALEVALGASPDTKTGCNLSVPLAYLVPATRDYVFRRDEDNSRVAAQLELDVAEFGLPFCEAHASPVQCLLRHFEEWPPSISGRSSFVPVALLAQGRREQAIEAARRFAAEFDSRRASGRSYHEFVKRLEGYVA